SSSPLEHHPRAGAAALVPGCSLPLSGPALSRLKGRRPGLTAPPALLASPRQQSQPKGPGEKPPRSKKAKELKPKVKKLKYHQYIPPDQKQDKGAPPMDSSYAKILQQQQLFLQLQILNQQQQQHYNYQTILPAPPKPAGEPQGGSSPSSLRALPAAALGGSASCPPGPNSLGRQNSVSGKLGPLPSNLDDMKVAELKQELKLRALPVSGTKTDLIERLRAYQEHAGAPGPATGPPKPGATPILAKAGEVVVAFPAARLSAGPALMAAGLAPAEVVVATVTSNGVVKFGSTGSTPPVSPTPSERSLLSTGDENSTGGGGGAGDAFGEMVTSPLTQLTLQASPVHILVKEERPAAARPEGRDKDQMLLEKDKQIQELTRMLRQKQQLVEMLRLQLEQEKRAQHGQQVAPRPQVKREGGPSGCRLADTPD
ncbi:myocardin-related transcription factor A-like, partial [Gracilinanus agilis]|uniref:myocardin-related transcription factor A-like n=1 Tax=Gracilinanus agilis TaxID=191870 RepID=UPI001CFDB06D